MFFVTEWSGIVDEAVSVVGSGQGDEKQAFLLNLGDFSSGRIEWARCGGVAQ
jgi:hypothetical protein